MLRSRLTRPSFGGGTRSFGRAARVINGRLASLTGINDFHPLWGRGRFLVLFYRCNTWRDKGR